MVDQPNNPFANVSEEDKNQALLRIMQMMERVDEVSAVINRADGVPLSELTPQLWGELQNVLPIANAVIMMFKAGTSFMSPIIDGEEPDMERFHETHGESFSAIKRLFED